MTLENHAEFVKRFIREVKTHRSNTSNDIESFIIDKSASEELTKDMAQLQKSIWSSLETFARDILKPKLEFTHVLEAGFRIWGARDNMAISKSTMSCLLHEIKAFCAESELNSALHIAGAKSAFQFFDDFLSFLVNDSHLILPENQTEFMKTLAAFDQRSSWWNTMPEFQDEGLYKTIILDRPFTSYPWSDGDTNDFNSFLSSYLLTLANCSSDFLRIANWIREREFKEKGTYTIYCDQLPNFTRKRSIYRLISSTIYSEDFIDLDTSVFITQTARLLSGAEDTFEYGIFPDFYKRFVEQLSLLYKKDLEFSSDIVSEIERRKQLCSSSNLVTPEAIFVDLRFRYQEFKLDFLRCSDSAAKKVRDDADAGID